MSKSAEKGKAAQHERHLARRRAARARKAAEKRLAEGNEEGTVDPHALGVAPAVIGGATLPKKMREARANLTEAFELMGGVPELVRWGKRNPTEFYRIWARLIPKEVAEETTRLPLEELLSKLSDRASMSVADAAIQIGQEAMGRARQEVNLEDAVAAFNLSAKGTLQ